MKKILLSATSILMLFACQNDVNDTKDSETTTVARRSCASQEVLTEQLAADPSLAIRMNQIEAFTKKSLSSPNYRLSSTGKIIIPVVVNVLYRTAAENISDVQIQSQIDVLNKDFTATNSDFNSTPELFAGVATNVDITFELVTIKRKSTSKTSWGTRML